MRQIALGCLGTALFVLAARSWRDGTHLVYDSATGFVTSLFIAQLTAEGLEVRIDGYWIARAAMVAVLGIATAGRIIRGWAVSGHLSFVLAIALVQLANPELPWFARLCYTLPVPLVLAIRLRKLDQGDHAPTQAGVALAALCAATVILAFRP
jgi:hypothetical protein